MTGGMDSDQVFRVTAWVIALPLFLLSGCAVSPYHFGRFHPLEPNGAAVQPVEVVYGKQHKTLDQIGWVVGTPARVLTLNKNIDNHQISTETVELLKVYMAENDITDVFVAVNDYDPKGQWRRLRENDRVAPFWRYSVGTLTWMQYTLFPNRVFGGDRYDPYSNSLNLTSDVPALVLSEAAYAKDIHSQRHPGMYAAIVNDLPLLSVWRRAKATSDVLGYAQIGNDWTIEEQAYHVLYPHIGAGAFGLTAHFVPVVGPFVTLGGAAVGHVAGRTVSYVQRPESAGAAGQPRAVEADRSRSTPTLRESLPHLRSGVNHADYTSPINE